MAIQSVRGMHDLFGEPMLQWHFVEKHVRSIFDTFGYKEIRTPVMENVEVFSQAVGEATDIVEKQMYVIERDKQSYALRPEGTAAFMRAVIQHQLHRQPQAQRYFYYLPMFRYERPQKGRLRQFFQFGAEFINDESPEADAEIIVMLHHIYQSLGLTQYDIRINSIGGKATRAKYREALQEYFRPHLGKLDDDSKKRFERAPMRILDSKEASIQKLIQGAPLITDYLEAEDREHFEGLKACLTSAGVSFEVDPRIVRGLDYYCRTAFEFVSDLLGAQSALVGGGRYDGLSERFGESPIPAVGFALGVERLLLALEASQKIQSDKLVPHYFFVPLGEAAWEVLYPLSLRLKQKGIPTEIVHDKDKSLKALLKHANRVEAENAVILGEEELKEKKVLLKNMVQRMQVEIALGDLEDELVNRYQKNSE